MWWEAERSIRFFKQKIMIFFLLLQNMCAFKKEGIPSSLPWIVGFNAISQLTIFSCSCKHQCHLEVWPKWRLLHTEQYYNRMPGAWGCQVFWEMSHLVNAGFFLHKGDRCLRNILRTSDELTVNYLWKFPTVMQIMGPMLLSQNPQEKHHVEGLSLALPRNSCQEKAHSPV